MPKLAFLTLLICCATLLAQSPSTGQLSARIEGRVTNLAGEPVAKASVRLRWNSPSQPGRLPPVYTTSSDPDGNFAFESIDPGMYQLTVERVGYLIVFYAPSAGGPYSFGVAPGQRLTGVAIKMTPQAVLSGKIQDEDGEPAPAARVRLYRWEYVKGRKQLIVGASATAGADGRYSIGNLSAGSFVLAADEAPAFFSGLNHHEISGHGGDDRQYVTTYYPGVTKASEATLIKLSPSTQIQEVDVRLTKSNVFHISGKVVDAATGAPTTASVALQQRDRIEGMQSPAENGVFEFNRLVPGSYILTTRPGVAKLGRQIVTISNQNIEDLVFPVGSGVNVIVKANTSDEASAHQQQAIRDLQHAGRAFTLTPVEGPNNGYMAQSKDDGTTLFRNVAPGTFLLGISSPVGGYVKSIHFDNQDITHKPLDIGTEEGVLEITYSFRAADITGPVHDAVGHPVSGARVTLWMPGFPADGTLDFFKSSVTDNQGSYQFANLPPGEYRLAAWDGTASESNSGLIAEPAFHYKFDSRAATITLGEGVHKSIEAPLIGRDLIEAAATQLN
jgi:protocatechuate 3,4-dioxygenase beta subunit